MSAFSVMLATSCMVVAEVASRLHIGCCLMNSFSIFSSLLNCSSASIPVTSESRGRALPGTHVRFMGAAGTAAWFDGLCADWGSSILGGSCSDRAEGSGGDCCRASQTKEGDRADSLVCAPKCLPTPLPSAGVALCLFIVVWVENNTKFYKTTYSYLATTTQQRRTRPCTGPNKGDCR